MSDNSNADTEADEQTVAELKERIGELEERVEQQEEAQRGTSRRQFLGSLTGIASAGAAGYYLGTQRAQAAPSWGSASGQMGTDSTPLSDVIAQTGTFQSLSAGSAAITNLGVSAHMSTQPSITSTNFTPLPIDRDLFSDPDPPATLDNTNNKIIIQEPGKYDIDAGINIRDMDDGDSAIGQVYVNGSAEIYDDETVGTASTRQSVTMAKSLQLSAGDELELVVWHDSGESKEITSADNRTYLTVVKLG